MHSGPERLAKGLLEAREYFVKNKGKEKAGQRATDITAKKWRETSCKNLDGERTKPININFIKTFGGTPPLLDRNHPVGVWKCPVCPADILSNLCGITVKQRGRERKGPPEIIQKFRLRKWPISSADFPMAPMERTEHHFGPFREKDLGAVSGGPFFSWPLCFTADM